MIFLIRLGASTSRQINLEIWHVFGDMTWWRTYYQEPKYEEEEEVSILDDEEEEWKCSCHKHNTRIGQRKGVLRRRI